MPLQRPRDLLRWLQPAADRPGVPTVEETGAPAPRRAGPEVTEVLLDRPRPTGLQVGSLNRQYLEVGIFIEVLFVVEEQLAKSRQRAVAILAKLSMLRATHLIDRLAEVPRDVELIVDDLRPRYVLRCTAHERLPHVHRDGTDGLDLLGSQRFPKRIARGRRSLGNDFEHSRPIDVGHHGDVIVSATEALLVDANVGHRFGIASLQAPLDGGLQDPMSGVPGESEQLSRSLDVGCRLENSDREGFEHQGKPRVLAGPRNTDRLDPTLFAAAAGHGGPDLRRELHRVEMPPGSLRGRVGSGTRLSALRATQLRPGERKVDDHLSPGQIEVHLVDVPRIVQTEQVTVVLIEIVPPASIRKHRKTSHQPLNSAKNLGGRRATRKLLHEKSRNVF